MKLPKGRVLARLRQDRWLATIIVLALGCRPTGQPATGVETRDSAGVRIVTNPRAALDEPASRLRLAARPRVEIGVI